LRRAHLRSLSSGWCFAALIAATAVYYLFLLSNGTFRIFAPEMLDKAFDSILLHLLRGSSRSIARRSISRRLRATARPTPISGIVPALLWLPALRFVEIARASLARLSCLTAVVLYVAIQLRMLVIAHESLPPRSRMHSLLGVMVAATALSGPQLYMLGSAAIYHEPILWSAVMAATFNLVVARVAFQGGRLATRHLVWLAILAGLAINTRASIGGALYLGTILLICQAVWKRYSSSHDERLSMTSAGCAHDNINGTAADPCIALPIAVLLSFVIIAATVNFERWGNPFRFVDYQYYDFSNLHRQNDFAVIRDFGEVSLGRAWIGAFYYATGIPYALKAVPPFAEFLHSRYQAIEAPPITPVLTNPLTILLGTVGLYRLWSNPPVSTEGTTLLRLVLIGHAAAVLVIFGAMYFGSSISLRFGALHELGGSHRLPGGLHRGGRDLQDPAQTAAHRLGGAVFARYLRQPLRSYDPQGVEHRRPDIGPPRSTAFCAFRPCSL
jgi:hypothetical protein